MIRGWSSKSVVNKNHCKSQLKNIWKYEEVPLLDTHTHTPIHSPHTTTPHPDRIMETLENFHNLAGGLALVLVVLRGIPFDPKHLSWTSQAGLISAALMAAVAGGLVPTIKVKKTAWGASCDVVGLGFAGMVEKGKGKEYKRIFLVVLWIFCWVWGWLV